MFDDEHLFDFVENGRLTYSGNRMEECAMSFDNDDDVEPENSVPLQITLFACGRSGHGGEMP
jgi:hypothetical protein